jgi:F0F1-type ATP synthase membrane subunit b/b'
MSGIYLKPFQKIIEKRNQSLKDDVQGATDLLKNVEAKLQDYEKSLIQFKSEAKAKHDEALSKARAYEEEAILKHREEIKKEYLKSLEKLQDEKLKVESELKMQITTMADSIAQKVLTGK